MKLYLEILLSLFLIFFAENIFSQIQLKIISPGTNQESGFLVHESRPTFNWQKVPQAKGYSVYVAEKENEFYKLIYNSSKHNAISDTFFVAPNNLLKPNTFYRWNVKAILYSGKSVFSSTLYFKTSNNLKTLSTKPIETENNLNSRNDYSEPGLLISKPMFIVSWQKDKRKLTNVYLAKKIGKKFRLIWKSGKIPPSKSSIEIPAKFLSDKSFFRWNMKIVDAKRRTTYTKPQYFHTDFSTEKMPEIKLTPAELISPGTNDEYGTPVEPNHIILKFNSSSDSTKNIISVYEIIGTKEKLIFTSDTLIGKTLSYRLKNDLLENKKLYFWQIKSIAGKDNFVLSDKLFFRTEKKPELPLIIKPHNFAKEDIFLEMKYAGIVKKTIYAIYENGIVYLPVSEILASLEVDSKFDYQKNILSAKNIFTKKNLLIDINKNKIEFADSTFEYSKYKSHKTDFDIYFPSEFFSDVLNIETRVDMGNLVVLVNSEQPLPVLNRKLRESKYGLINLHQQAANSRIDFDRQQKYFNFGFFDYQLSHTINKLSSPNGFFSFGGGGEVLGGDFQLNTNGNFQNSKFSENRSSARWQYVFRKNKFISSFSAGTLDFDGLQYTTFDGISITNSPVEPRTNFGKIKIIDQAEPNYTIELYMNNQLIDIAKSDAVGNFSFDLPLNYGTTLVKLKYFGPFGEYYERIKVYQTPLLLLQEEEFNYAINVGRQNITRFNLKNFTAAYGFTNWLTTKFGFEHLEVPNQKAVIYNSTSARLYDNYFANFSFSPNNFYGINLDALFASQIAFDFSYDKFLKQGFFNQSNIDNKISAHLFYPILINGFQINAQSFYSLTSSKSNKINDFSLGVSSTFSYINPSVNYHLVHVNSNNIFAKNDNIDLGINWSLNFLQQHIQFIRGSLLTSRYYYNLTKSKNENWTIAFSTNLTENGRFQISYTNNFLTKFKLTQLNLVFYFPTAQYSTSISRETFSNSLIGSIGYNMQDKNLTFYNRNQVGRAGAVIRLFIDENNNNIFDANEETVKNAKIDISVADIKYLDNGFIIAHDLIPYTVYDFQIREESIKNPLLISKQKIYSFVTEPNTFKPINIPLHIAGEISGKVYRIINNNKIPIAGLKIHIKNLTTNDDISFNTFSDGSYYFFGLIPSKYEIYADEEQLKSIGLEQTNKEINFEIKSKSYGDSIDNLDIILVN